MNEDFRRTLEFENELAAAASTIVRDVEVGTLYVNEDLPDVWDRNILRLDERSQGRSANYLSGLADELLGSVGAKHRKIYVADDFASEEMREGFKSLEWSQQMLATMAYRSRTSVPGAHTVDEVDASAYSPFERACVEASPAQDDGVKEQLVSLVPLMAKAGRGRFFVARDGAEMVSGCHLYSDGRVAQVEDVMTLEPHRRRGLAGSVVARAVDEALAEGNELIFLLVEDEGGPKRLYGRLGFEEIGRTLELFKDPT